MLNRLQAVFASLKKHEVKMEYQGQAFHVVSRKDLVASKRAAGREVDLEDVRLLELGDEEEET